MSEQGLEAAAKYGESLPQFSDRSEAEKTLLVQKDKTLKELIEILSSELDFDYSLESLKRFELWYFDNGEPKEVSRLSVPLALGFYYGEVLCRQGKYEWIVDEFVFRRGTYEIGVTRGLVTIMLTNGKLPEERNNKRRQSLFRDAKRWI